MHASVARRKKLVIDWISASELEQEAKKEVCLLHFILITSNHETLETKSKMIPSLQNPDAYKAAWKLLKV